MNERSNETVREAEIDLQKLLGLYVRRWWIILLCILAGALVMLLVSMQFITPQYRVNVTFYVNNSRNNQPVESISSQSLSASQQLVNTYINIIQSETVMGKVAENLHNDLTTKELREMVTASQTNDTELFQVFVTSPDPAEAVHIANVIADVAPGQLEYFVEGSSTKVIDRAQLPEKPYSPSVKRNVEIGALAGLVLSLLVITVVHLLDVRVKEESDLTELFTYPVLGQIPLIDGEALIPETGKNDAQEVDAQ